MARRPEFYYLGDDSAHIVAELEAHRDAIETCARRDDLRELMPRGGARNAVDCAMWELDAKRRGTAAWRLAKVDRPKPLVTTFTLGADDPAAMAEGARRYVRCARDQGQADRRARPRHRTGPRDSFSAARTSGSESTPTRVIRAMSSSPSSKRSPRRAWHLLEQPLPRGKEADLDGYRSPIPIAADESALGLDDVAGLVGRFDVINIKLDKCGGLTEALLIAEEARRHGLGVMVGNMVGTSLAMAPAFIVGQQCDVVDLDGPTFLREDRTPSCEYRDGTIWCPDEVWGSRLAA